MNNSPISFLAKSIEKSLEYIAPEKSKELNEFYEAYSPSFHYSDKQEFSVRVNTATCKVTISVNALEYLWASCYAYYVLYQKYSKANELGAENFDLHGDEQLVTAMQLLKWGQTRILASAQLTEWGEHLPKPNDNNEFSDVANELFLCAIAWILHHEIAHVYHQHPNVLGSDGEAKQQEKEADQSATNWIMESKNTPLVEQKRILGIAIAILAMTAEDILTGVFDKATHPKSFERLDDALHYQITCEDHLVYAFCVTTLHANMAMSGLKFSIGSEKETWKDHFTNCLIDLSRQEKI
ncbi:hypothetical protein GQ856_24010 [Vibrio parahaemolyticus]|nr:hypothetical protein [Vibrio parahaemolyticus]